MLRSQGVQRTCVKLQVSDATPSAFPVIRTLDATLVVSISVRPARRAQLGSCRTLDARKLAKTQFFFSKLTSDTL